MAALAFIRAYAPALGMCLSLPIAANLFALSIIELPKAYPYMRGKFEDPVRWRVCVCVCVCLCVWICVCVCVCV